MNTTRWIALTLTLAAAATLCAQDLDSVQDRYEKAEYLIPMRDGVRLFTSVYTPRDRSSGPAPILLFRTPYSIRPYGEDQYRTSLGPSTFFQDAGYVFVYQDVRGKYMSEGEFENMRPQLASGADGIDESTDTYDTIEWLVTNVEGHNGRAGMWGISYPGFYAAAGMIDAHPALMAVSPQAPIADFYFDDFHHHGAFFLPHAFNFISSFGRARPEPTMQGGSRIDHGTRDGYSFFMQLGSLKNANERYLHGEIAFWNDIVAHPNYDAFWQARNLLPHLDDVAPAVMTVGGWFDAEDLYGPLNIYRSIERNDPDVLNSIVMGPWRHGGWSRTDGDELGNARFGARTSLYYREHLEFPFFEHHLRGDGTGDFELAEATVFETGANRWRAFDAWPPADRSPRTLYMSGGGSLDWSTPSTDDAFDSFVSDPAKPVPFSEDIATGMTRNYMTDDQRFAARRPDVLVYQTEPLQEPVTIAGPILAELFVSTSRQDADWVVKLIDVFPPDAPDHANMPRGRHMSEYQMMIRSEVIRGRFRNDYAKPEPFNPGEVTYVDLPLQDVLHTFQPGHRIMIQVQSTWFPLVDRNPQTWVDNIFLASDDDFAAAEHRVYRSGEHASRISFDVIESPAP